MSWPAYPEYKESGADWLGRVPKHWQAVPVRAIVEERADKNVDGENQNYLSLVANVGVIPYAEKGDVGNKKPEDLSRCKLVKKGDLVLNSMNFGIGSYGISAFEGVCSQVYIVLRPNLDQVYGRYALRIFEDKEFQRLAQSFGQGILAHRAAIGWDDLKGIPIPLPPNDEQQNIRDFLDHETARIDSLIEEQQRLFDLLREKRQAVISHAVSKGLHTDVPMKDSRVEWLGDVPAHWDVGQLRYKAILESGHTPSRSRPELWVDCHIPWFTLADVWQIRKERRRHVYETQEAVSQLGLQESSARLLPEGSVILSRTASVGFPAILGKPMAVSQDFAVWICGEQIDSEYLWFVLQGMRPDFRRLMMGSTHQTIYMPDIREIRVALPPLQEQHEIVSHLNNQLEKIDALVDSANAAVELLRERRSALISAAVTGKIDVRGWKPQNAPMESELPRAAETEAPNG